MMSLEEAQQLILKYRAGKCTEKEKALLESWYMQLGKGQQAEISESELELVLAEVWSKLPVNEESSSEKIVPINRNMAGTNPNRFWLRIAAAAILILGVFGIGRLVMMERTSSQVAAVNNNSIEPGGNKAVLFLSDNSKIQLSGQHLGFVAQQEKTIIRKTGDGIIAYEGANATQIGTNTIETPAGGQFRAVLPDGTKVWLNAASKITYPVSFAGLNERRVKLTGEAYFEVKHNAKKPFYVETSDQVTEDIGTAFNVNSYKDEPATKTTLIEGSVRVIANQDTSKKRSSTKGQVLKPGQQATVQSGQIKVQGGLSEQASDWKNEEFIFDHQTIEEIMRKISRWYNVKVVYKKNVDLAQTFGGQVPRSTPIRQVLKGLEATGNIKFDIKGRTVTVSAPVNK